MPVALYRKYRPQTFKDLIGQNHIRITLQNEIEQGQIGHAYLFCGPRGLGKTTTARLLAKAINCENRKAGESEPCNRCSSCLDIMANRNVDIIEIDAASNTGVDNVRENIIENSRFTPTKCQYKVFIIDEVHMMSPQAFNALLKTLEEPPAHVIFILCTTETYKLPLTIISRCQRFDFRKVSAENMTKRLELIIADEKKEVDPEVIKRVIFYSEGCVRDAESLLGKIFSLGDKITLEQAEIILPRSDFGSVLRLLAYLAERNPTAAIELINKLLIDGVDPAAFNENIIELLRKLILIKISPQLGDFSLELGEDYQKLAVVLATKLDFAELISLVELFMSAGQEIKHSPIMQFPLEMAIVEFCENINCRDNDERKKLGPALDQKIKSIATPPAPAELKKKDQIKPPVINAETDDSQAGEIKSAAISDKSEEISAAIPAAAAVSNISSIDSDSQLAVPVEIFRQQWPQIVKQILKKNYSVSSVLRLSQPVKISGRELEIAVKTKFFKDRLDCTANKLLIEAALAEIAGAAISVKVIVNAATEPLKEMALPDSPPESSPAAAIDAANAPISAPLNPPSPKADAIVDVMGMF